MAANLKKDSFYQELTSVTGILEVLVSVHSYGIGQLCKLRHADDIYPRGSMHMSWVLAWTLARCVFKW